MLFSAGSLTLSVLLYAPTAIYAFDDNEVFLPASVIKELGERTKTSGELRANAMEAVKLLDSICDVPGEAVHLKNGGILEIAGRLDDSIYDVAAERNAVIATPPSGSPPALCLWVRNPSRLNALASTRSPTRDAATCLFQERKLQPSPRTKS